MGSSGLRAPRLGLTGAAKSVGCGRILRLQRQRRFEVADRFGQPSLPLQSRRANPKERCVSQAAGDRAVRDLKHAPPVTGLDGLLQARVRLGEGQSHRGGQGTRRFVSEALNPRLKPGSTAAICAA